MLGISGVSFAGARAPLTMPTLKLWVDSVTGVSGSSGGAVDSVSDQSPAANNLSNTSGAGSRPVWADATTNAGADMFKSGTKNGFHFEAGGDWLSLSGLDTATAFICPNAMTVFHTSRHTNVNTVPTNGNNTPLNIIGTVGSTVTLYTNVGFSAGKPQFMTWTGSAYVFYSATRTNLNDGNPHDVCWVYSGTNLSCYIDGALDSTQAVAAYQTTNGFNGLGGNTNTDAWEGGLAEVMVWNDVLTPAQVSSLHTRAVSLWF